MTALREGLADYAHAAWTGWMLYLFEKSQPYNEDGSITIPAEYVKNLKRLMDTPYQDMPEASKESDRVEADKMLALVRKYIVENPSSPHTFDVGDGWDEWRKMMAPGIEYVPEVE